MPPVSENPSPKTEGKETNDENQDVTVARAVTEVRHYSGPIPPAEEFARYEEIYPGSGARLFSMAEREQKDVVSFRKWSLIAATFVAITSVIAIAVILTANPESLVLVALAIAYALPAITDFIRGIVDSQLSRKERELEIQIRKDNHELDMIAARQRLELDTGSEDSVTRRANRLEAGNDSSDLREGNQKS